MESFDYIIVGSGAAGAVIASRLTEDENVKVLLLEAGGPDHHPLQNMPMAFPKVIANSNYNWRFESEPERALNGRKVPTPRGRTLGGSTEINAGIAIRGNPRDYDIWREAGLEGWGYADVLPYFRRLESHWRGATKLHGGDGPVRITRMAAPALLFEPLVEAASALQIPLNDDPNGAAQDGLCQMEATIDRGRRASTSNAYLRPARRRPNLAIRTNALATRVVMEEKRAVGIAYRHGGQETQSRAKREVILAAGSFGSPQLLLLSGIGPGAHLREFGIPQIHDLPGVGENLGEHPNILNIYKTHTETGMTRYLRFDRATVQVLRWLFFRDGPFATNGATANFFLRSLPGLDRPDVQLTPHTITGVANLWFPLLTAAPLHCFEIRIGVLHPRSRGTVRLRSRDPADKPRITYNLFQAQEDIDAMVRAINLCRRVYATKPLSDMIEQELAPGSAVTSEADLADYIRANCGHRSHPVGTCKMGVDEMAVVDGQLRVRGLEGLRVADASVMPETPSGNTNLPTMMIGEKAADLIRGRLLV
jgi:choline dehydrogenase